MSINSLHLTLSLTEAFIGNGWEDLKGYIGIPGMYNDGEIMLYLKPHISIHSAAIEADGVAFQLKEDNCPPPVDSCLWAVNIIVNEGRVVEAEVV